jgi:hypothetical protein
VSYVALQKGEGEIRVACAGDNGRDIPEITADMTRIVPALPVCVLDVPSYEMLIILLGNFRVIEVVVVLSSATNAAG